MSCTEAPVHGPGPSKRPFKPPKGLGAGEDTGGRVGLAGAGAKAQPGKPGLGSTGTPPGTLVATPTGGVGAGAALAKAKGLGEGGAVGLGLPSKTDGLSTTKEGDRLGQACGEGLASGKGVGTTTKARGAGEAAAKA